MEQERAPAPKPSSGAARDKFGSLSVGHLVTSNNNVLKAGQFNVGTLFTGAGITNDLMIGFSPFVLATYEMNNLLVRYATNVTSRERIGVDFQYFKTFGQDPNEHGDTSFCTTSPCPWRDQYPNGFSTFKMEAWDAKLTYNNQITSYYRFNITGSFYYYINDERPFSLRMDPGPDNLDPYALTLTTLHEFRLSRGFYMNVELGAWGMNYTYPYIHSGLSFDVQYDNLLLGLGASSTYSPGFPPDQAKKFANYTSIIAVHPEIQAQVLF